MTQTIDGLAGQQPRELVAAWQYGLGISAGTDAPRSRANAGRRWEGSSPSAINTTSEHGARHPGPSWHSKQVTAPLQRCGRLAAPMDQECVHPRMCQLAHPYTVESRPQPWLILNSSPWWYIVLR